MSPNLESGMFSLTLVSKAQYERMFKKWGVSKNVTATEWKYIIQQLQQREAQHKKSIVSIRGVRMPENRIHKQRRVHEYKTTIERCIARKSPISLVI
jgi:hypothetical protein